MDSKSRISMSSAVLNQTSKFANEQSAGIAPRYSTVSTTTTSTLEPSLSRPTTSSYADQKRDEILHNRSIESKLGVRRPSFQDNLVNSMRKMKKLAPLAHRQSQILVPKPGTAPANSHRRVSSASFAKLIGVESDSPLRQRSISLPDNVSFMSFEDSMLLVLPDKFESNFEEDFHGMNMSVSFDCLTVSTGRNSDVDAAHGSLLLKPRPSFCGRNSVEKPSTPAARKNSEVFSRPANKSFLQSGSPISSSFLQNKKLRRGPLSVIEYTAPSAINTSLERSVVPRYAEDILSDSSYSSIAGFNNKKFMESRPLLDVKYVRERRYHPAPFKPKIIDVPAPYKIFMDR